MVHLAAKQSQRVQGLGLQALNFGWNVSVPSPAETLLAGGAFGLGLSLSTASDLLPAG